jgi:hypothetical protein
MFRTTAVPDNRRSMLAGVGVPAVSREPAAEHGAAGLAGLEHLDGVAGVRRVGVKMALRTNASFGIVPGD